MEATQPVASTKPKFNHEQLMDALYFTADLFSRPNIPFFLMGKTAFEVKNKMLLEGDRIDVGIRKVDLTLPTIGILDAFYTPEHFDGRKITYKYKDIPIFVHIVDSTESMFSSLDTFMYQYEPFSVPNPFNKYWEEHEKYEK